jgi:antitoxin HicB
MNKPRKVRGRAHLRYRILIEQDEDGIYIAECPALPGCVSQGNTRAQVLENIKDAIEGYIESLRKHGDPVPSPISEEVVEVSA